MGCMPYLTPPWRRARTTAVAAVVLAVACACSGNGVDLSLPAADGGRALAPAVSRSCHPGVNAAVFWIIGGSELNHLEAAAPLAVRHAIRATNLYVIESAGKTSPAGQTVAAFRSYAAFAAAIAARTIPSTTHWVLYDNERWPGTPVTEQHNPAHYEALFAALARRHGYRVILAPAQDLVYGFGRSQFRAGVAMWQRYLTARLAATSGWLADIYEIQAQPYEFPAYRPSGSYSFFVRAAVAQARAIAPHATIFAGLSTNRVTAAGQLLQDFNAVRGTVSGFWLNIPHPNQPRSLKLAARFLAGLPAAVSARARACVTG